MWFLSRVQCNNLPKFGIFLECVVLWSEIAIRLCTRSLTYRVSFASFISFLSFFILFGSFCLQFNNKRSSNAPFYNNNTHKFNHNDLLCDETRISIPSRVYHICVGKWVCQQWHQTLAAEQRRLCVVLNFNSRHFRSLQSWTVRTNFGQIWTKTNYDNLKWTQHCTMYTHLV